MHNFKYLLKSQYTTTRLKQNAGLVFGVPGVRGAVPRVGVPVPGCRIPGRDQLEQERHDVGKERVLARSCCRRECSRDSNEIITAPSEAVTCRNSAFP